MADLRVSQLVVETVSSPEADLRVTQIVIEVVSPLVADPAPEPEPEPEPTPEPPIENGIRWALHRFDMKFRTEQTS